MDKRNKYKLKENVLGWSVVILILFLTAIFSIVTNEILSFIPKEEGAPHLTVVFVAFILSYYLTRPISNKIDNYLRKEKEKLEKKEREEREKKWEEREEKRIQKIPENIAIKSEWVAFYCIDRCHDILKEFCDKFCVNSRMQLDVWFELSAFVAYEALETIKVLHEMETEKSLENGDDYDQTADTKEAKLLIEAKTIEFFMDIRKNVVSALIKLFNFRTEEDVNYIFASYAWAEDYTEEYEKKKEAIGEKLYLKHKRRETGDIKIGELFGIPSLSDEIRIKKESCFAKRIMRLTEDKSLDPGEVIKYIKNEISPLGFSFLEKVYLIGPPESINMRYHSICAAFTRGYDNEYKKKENMERRSLLETIINKLVEDKQ